MSDSNLTTNAITFSNWRHPFKLTSFQLASTPLDNQVLVKTQAVSINPVDIIIKSLYPPCIFGSSDKVVGGDFSGTIVKAGSKTSFKPADRVYGSVFNGFGISGSFSQYLLIDPKNAMFFDRIPEEMPFIQAACLPMVGGTALQVLETYKRPLKDTNILILGAGTSVGYYTIQLAKNYYGVKFVASTCSSRSFERVIKAGASKLIDYTKGSTHEVNDILEAVKGHGKFDVVIDIVRDTSLYPYLDKILKTKKEGGMFIEIRALKNMDYKGLGIFSVTPPWRYLWEYYKSLLGFSSFEIAEISDDRDDKFGGVIEKLWGERKLQVAVDSVWEFGEYAQAFERITAGDVKGKVVLTVD
ncbi:DEKNAAC105192 [Brettanomyces naardenensis]|uniref:DEKNAAC105192 n=1 Tax=Brettanomyces naardenensis TaxID=13370 RepID=A0A448YSU7_BRENA|nr:DEKNAAC105192 [Brettanomyces naardenensis]